MHPTDPIDAARAAKQTAALLREARSLLRRTEKLALAAADLDAAGPRLLADVRSSVERLVDHLARQERVQLRKAQDAVRRAR